MKIISKTSQRIKTKKFNQNYVEKKIYDKNYFESKESQSVS